MRRLWPAGLLGCAAVLLLAVPAGAATITEFDAGNPAAAFTPRYIHVGPDQNLWFADSGPKAGIGRGIGRISTAGERFPIISDQNNPVDLVTMPDGTVVWTADSGLGRRRPDGLVESASSAPAYAIALNAAGNVRFTATVTAFDNNTYGWVCRFASEQFGSNQDCAHGPGATRLTGLALDSSGKLWAAAYEENDLRRLDSAGDNFDLALDLPAGSGPARLALGSDGNLWVTMYDASAIDRISPSGARTRFALPAGAGPNDIAAGPDGALWFTELKAGKIGRMTLNGVLTNEFAIPTAGSQPIGITEGPDGAMWFTESATRKIGRLRLDSSLTGGGGAGGGGIGTGVRFAPRFVRGAAFNPRRFRVAAGATPTSAQVRRTVPRGSVLTYSLSVPATVVIVIARPAAGRKVGRTCRAPTRSNRRRRRCTRYVTVGTLRRRGLQGVNRVAFTGRIGRKALKPGSYRATATAKDAAGNASAPSAASFTIAP